MTDFLEVKPVRTFTLGKDLKTKKSDAFRVEAGEARLLDAQGLVEVVSEVKVDGDVQVTDPTETETETETETPAPAKRGRKAK